MLNYQNDFQYLQINLEVLKRGKVGPKDGNDFIGGNFVTSINFQTSMSYII
jgi:outer membrane protein insertion porin family